MSNRRSRPAFTMIELMFVIIILGIVSSIGAEIIAKVYQEYIVQRAQHKASIKVELASQQIANRLSSVIPGTVVRRLTKSGASEDITDTMTLDASGHGYTILQWVGSDVDSFEASSTQGWSGFCDVNDSIDETYPLSTPGSNLGLTNTIITNLNGGSLPVAWSPVVYFPRDPAHHDVDTPLSGTSIGLSNDVFHILEHYKFAWTSYALVVEDREGDGDEDLYLYYAFDPIVSFAIPDGTKSSLILKNISTFKFMGIGSTIRFKVCSEENIGEKDFNITACKEKAVF